MRFLRADHIFSGEKFLATDTVLVINENGLIHDFTTADKVEETVVEHFNGIICPGFVNAHCHLELSHLQNVIKEHTGIVDFGLGIIKHRNELALELQLEAMLLADKEMQNQGIVAVGDISNTNNSINVKKQSSLYYHTFIELIALNPVRANLVFAEGLNLVAEFQKNDLSTSLAPHAPYSVSLELIQQITDYCKAHQQPTTIHNQESEAENNFFQYKTGDYLRLYETLNLPIDYFNPSGNSSLQSVITSINKSVNTLLVHNTFSSKTDIEIVKQIHQQLFWCLCPKANLYIENSLPNVSLLTDSNCTLTLGTDSLASNSQLSIIDEINCLLQHQPSVSLEMLLKAATYNGALFLGIENKYGKFGKHKNCGINLIDGTFGKYSVKSLR